VSDEGLSGAEAPDIDRVLDDTTNGVIPVLINGAAGTGHTEAECENLRQVFREAGAEVRIIPARTGKELVELAQQVRQARPRTVVAGGGDGTVNAVASVVAGTGIALGILPLGTLNHFAKDLNIPLDLQEAARTIVHGQRVNVDVGEVNGQIFINNSSLGLYSRIVLERKQQQRRLGRSKWSALFWATLTVLRRSPFLNVHLRLEDHERRYRAPLVFIGNNEYVMEGFHIGKRERLDAGILSIYVTQRRSRWGLVGLALRALFGRLRQAKDFEALTAHTAEITTHRKHVHVATDGEVRVMDTPLRYRIRPRDLRVIVPAAPPTKTLT
jgi:YegS/Rv2252/BmrU family lipid kinase